MGMATITSMVLMSSLFLLSETTTGDYNIFVFATSQAQPQQQTQQQDNKTTNP